MFNELIELSEKIKYTFKDIKLLDLALCHRSSGKKNNERLEFLGDATVNFIIGEALFHKSPKAQEGDLSRLRASLVSETALAEVAREFDLAKYLRLGHGELRSGGANRISIQSDALEAIIGAVYLDSNFDTCKTVVLQWYEEKLSSIKSAEALKDHKTRLQEYLQARKFPLPEYVIVKTEGEAHNQTFHVECRVNGLSHAVIGIGQSRRKAEQDAAHKFFELIHHG